MEEQSCLIASIANDNKDRAFGNIYIPEVAYDTEDYVVKSN